MGYGFHEKGQIAHGGRINTAGTKLRGFYTKGPRVHQQRAIQLHYARSLLQDEEESGEGREFLFSYFVIQSHNACLQHISIYAAYLYDSAYLYARALDHLIRENEDLSIDEIARNGTLIIETIIKNHTYQST